MSKAFLALTVLTVVLAAPGLVHGEPYPTEVREAFLRECVDSCGAPECKAICACVLSQLEASVPVDALAAGQLDDATMEKMAMDCLAAAGIGAEPAPENRCDALVAKCDAGPCKGAETREETYACYEECVGKVDPRCVPADCFAVNEDCGYECDDKEPYRDCVTACVKRVAARCEPDFE